MYSETVVEFAAHKEGLWLSQFDTILYNTIFIYFWYEKVIAGWKHLGIAKQTVWL